MLRKTHPTQNKMNFSLACRIATSARTKLIEEANRDDRHLRLLVGHANLLDATMYRLEFASSEERSSTNSNVKSHRKHPSQRRIKWADEDEESDESDSQSTSNPSDFASEDMGNHYEIDRPDLALVRVPSHR